MTTTQDSSLQATFKVLFIFGPTGSGKTEVIERIHFYLPQVEVINADAIQVYRGLHIGATKPSSSSKVPYHLLDIRDPNEAFNVADFVSLAEKAVAEITARGGIPIVSGGSAYYFKHLWFGLPESPPGNSQIRQDLERRLVIEGLDKLREELAQIDPESNRRIQKNDAYRVVRALEVFTLTGRPLSSYHLPNRPRDDWEVLALGLQRERTELYERINRRTKTIFDAGLVNEILSLVVHGVSSTDPAMRAIGYREFFQEDVFSCLQAGISDPERFVSSFPESLRDRLIGRIQQASRNYAKRQITFFSRLPNVVWINPKYFSDIVSEIQSFFQIT